MKLYLARPIEREGERGGGETLVNFLKSCKHFLHISIFFLGPFLLRACQTERGKWATGGGDGGAACFAYIFRTCFGTFVMTGSNWVLSKLYIILHNIFFGAQVVPALGGYVARRANSMRHEYHVTQRLVGVL